MNQGSLFTKPKQAGQGIFFCGVALILLSFLTDCRSVHASVHDPLSQLKEQVERVLTILNDERLALPENHEERKRQVESVADDIFDFEEMAARSLANYWDQITPEEKDRFVHLFSKLVKQRYIGKIDSYSGQEIVFKKQIVKQKVAIIYSTVVDNNIEIPIDYKLIQKGNKWLIYDLRIENVSLVTNYRRDFFSIIKKDGYDELVKRLEEKVENFSSSQ